MAEKSHEKLEKKVFDIKSIGPGLTTGAADDDPSGIATYSQAGAQFGLGFLWLAPFTFPLMAIVQEMSARIGLVTGQGLASNIRRHYSRGILYFVTILLVIANTFNIGADLRIMAEVSTMLLPMVSQTVYIVLIALICVSLEVFVSYHRYSEYLKWLTTALVAYIITGFIVKFNIYELFISTVVPSIKWTKESFFILTGVLGTTISPYLFFWQSSQEIEEEINSGDTSVLKRQKDGPSRISGMRVDVWLGMFFSNLVMFFIIAVCGKTLYENGITDIQTAGQAALALKPLAGNIAYVLFSVGVLGTGFLAIPILAGSSAYAVAETFRWKEGLYQKFVKAKAFYFVIILSTLAGLGIHFANLNPIKSLLYAAVLNGLIAPIIIVFILLLAQSHAVMGAHRNRSLTNILGWMLVILMCVSGLITIWSILS